MANRLIEKIKANKAAVAAGCIFAMVLLASTAAPSNAGIIASADIISDSTVITSAALSWAMSDRDMSPGFLLPGQEIVTGTAGATYLTGDGGTLHDSRELNLSENIQYAFSHASSAEETAIYDDTISHRSWAAYSSPVVCDPEVIATTRDGNLSRTPYTEIASTGISSIASNVTYATEGLSIQADSEEFDSYGVLGDIKQAEGFTQIKTRVHSLVGASENASDLNLEVIASIEHGASGRAELSNISHGYSSSNEAMAS